MSQPIRVVVACGVVGLVATAAWRPASAERPPPKAPAKHLGENVGKLLDSLDTPELEAAREARKTERIVLRPPPSAAPSLEFSPWSVAPRTGTADAAQAYLRAMTVLDREALRDERLWQWMDGPLDDLRAEGDWVAEWLKQAKLKEALRHLRFAAEQSSCNWSLPPRGTEDENTARSDAEVQMMGGGRDLARVLLVQIRLHLARGEFAAAADLLRLGMALGERLGETPSLSPSLGGLTIIALLRPALVDWIAQPDAPSLYWALAARPRPLVDIRGVLLAEARMPYDPAFATTRAALERELSDDEYRQAMRLAPIWIDGLGGSMFQSGPLSDAADAELLSRFRKRQAIVRPFLLERGYAAADLDAMSERRQMLIYAHRRYDDLCERLLARILVPAPEGTANVQAVYDELRALEESGDEVIPWGSMFLTALPYARTAQMSCERNFDALTIIEGIRLYVGAHDGKLPATLAELDVPIRGLDIVADAPFHYRVDGAKAELRLPGQYPEGKISWHTYELVTE